MDAKPVEREIRDELGAVHEEPRAPVERSDRKSIIEYDGTFCSQTEASGRSVSTPAATAMAPAALI